METNLKATIYKHCLDFVAQKILACQECIQAAQETSKGETKSSAGDKYETTRAMMQIEIENNTKRLVEAQELQKILLQITWQERYEMVGMGSLVKTNHGIFFIAIGIGQLKIDTLPYFIVSPASPIGGALMKKKVSESFTFLSKNYEILEIL